MSGSEKSTTDAKISVKLRTADLTGILLRLNKWRQQEILCDLQLRSTSGDCEWVHKLIILAASPGLQPSRIVTPSLNLPCSTPALKALVRFLYGEEAGVSPETVFELKLCAEGLGISSLVLECDAAMQRLAHSTHQQLHRLHQPPTPAPHLLPPPSHSTSEQIKLEAGDAGSSSLEGLRSQPDFFLYHSQRRSSLSTSSAIAASALVGPGRSLERISSAADSTTQRSRCSRSDNEADDCSRDVLSHPALKRKMSSDQIPFRKRGVRAEVDRDIDASTDETSGPSEVKRLSNPLGSTESRAASGSSRLPLALPPVRQRSVEELLNFNKEIVAGELIPRPRGTLTAKLEMIRQANRQLMGDFEHQGMVPGRLSHKLQTIRKANEELLRNYPNQRLESVPVESLERPSPEGLPHGFVASDSDG